MDDFTRSYSSSASVRLRKGNKELTFNIEDMTVSRIAAAFSLQPPLHLIKEFDNAVLFPSDSSGKFNPLSLSPGTSYEVQGNEQRSSADVLGIQTPFGAYPFTNFVHSNPLPHPPSNAPWFKQRSIKKTVLVANLSPIDPSKASSSKHRFNHTIVTQVILSLDASKGECNVSVAAESVRKQLGFEVVLLDCKLFPITDNESISSPDFWRSTRKIIAASRSVYEKITGVSVGSELSQVDDDVILLDTLRKKQKMSTSTDIISKFNAIDKKLDTLDKKLSFLDDIKKVFECVICRSTVYAPLVSPCCNRIIGCRTCVTTWRNTHSRCPLCSVSGRMADAFELKGIDDFTALFRAGENLETSANVDVDVDTVSTGASDEFEDLPAFSVPRSQ